MGMRPDNFDSWRHGIEIPSHYYPLVSGILWSPVGCFHEMPKMLCDPEQAVETIIELTVIWDAMALLCRHCNSYWYNHTPVSGDCAVYYGFMSKPPGVHHTPCKLFGRLFWNILHILVVIVFGVIIYPCSNFSGGPAKRIEASDLVRPSYIHHYYRTS